MSSVRTRIAPSPTGYPHIGTVFQALLDYVIAKKNNGEFVVRIEDTDRSRLVEDAEEKIYEALEFFNLTPDEGPKYGGEYGPYRQSDRLDIYQKYAQELVEADHAYYCFCSPERLQEVRQKMQKLGQPPMYDQHCRSLSKQEAQKRVETEPHVIRMKVPSGETITVHDEIRGDIEFDSDTVDDQVILKSDGFPTYHLAVVVDDHLMEISHVIRGEEWLSSAPKHILLYRYLGWDIPKIIHTPILRNPDRSKLSKRHGHASVSWYVEQGYLKEAVINFLATRVWNHPSGEEIFGLEELIEHFNIQNMHIQGPVVDLDKLNWLNGQWMRKKSDEELLELLQDYKPEGLSEETLKKVLPHIKERLVVLSDIQELTEYFHEEPALEAKALLKQSKMTEEETADYLEKVKQVVENIGTFTAEGLEAELRELQQEEGLKPRAAFMAIRVAVSGRTATPPLFDVMEILGKETVVSRLNQAQEVLKS